MEKKLKEKKYILNLPSKNKLEEKKMKILTDIFIEKALKNWNFNTTNEFCLTIKISEDKDEEEDEEDKNTKLTLNELISDSDSD